MFNLGNAESCVCIRRGDPSSACGDQLVFQERGKKVSIRPKSHEKAKLVVLDSCFITNKYPKCDAVFFLETETKGFALLIELKGDDIDHAFEQLKFTKEKQLQYVELKDLFSKATGKACKEYAFIVSNHQINKIKLQKLEKTHEMRVKAILHSEATMKIPDIRAYL
jgi:hypothetical protein